MMPPLDRGSSLDWSSGMDRSGVSRISSADHGSHVNRGSSLDCSSGVSRSSSMDWSSGLQVRGVVLLRPQSTFRRSSIVVGKQLLHSGLWDCSGVDLATRVNLGSGTDQSSGSDPGSILDRSSGVDHGSCVDNGSGSWHVSVNRGRGWDRGGHLNLGSSSGVGHGSILDCSSGVDHASVFNRSSSVNWSWLMKGQVRVTFLGVNSIAALVQGSFYT